MAVTAETARLQNLAKQGQSVWLDNLGRKLIRSGELVRLRDAGVTGITSNPTIFEKAISGSADYDAGLAKLVTHGRQPNQILWDLMIEDIQAAADIFRPVYDSTSGADGFVSITSTSVVSLDRWSGGT
jgi:transaldolase